MSRETVEACSKQGGNLVLLIILAPLFFPREEVESSIFIYANYLVVLIIKMGKHDIPSRLLYVDQYDSEG